MSKVARTIGKIAGAVSSIARVIPGGQIVAAIAGAVAITAGVVGALTAKKPIARGNSSQVLIGANLPIPYTMGRAYIGGNLIHDIGYGGTVDGVPNPYAAMTFTYGIGPWESFESFQADYAAIPLSGNAATGYYGGFLYIDRLLGATPETRALAANWAGEPGWSPAHKMSGHAQAKWSWKFDKKGKVNAGGFPATGVISGMGVQAYDPRLDSTYPGGSGTQRLADRSTWGYNANPALHAGSYAQGVYHNGKKVFGVDLGGAAIDWPTIVDWANVCDANGWTINGTIFEPGDKWNNLKLIAQAGSAEPAFTGGVLTFRYDAPHVSLDTITVDDLADDELTVPGAANPEERPNGIIGKYRSEANQWEMVQSDLISVPAYVTADGEERQEEYETLLVTGKDQAARLATYRLVNGREIPGIILPCKPRLFEYQIGDALTVGTATQDIEGLAGQLCVIVGRTPNFERGTVTLELITETASKHAFALGQSGTAPPPPVLVSAEMRDTISFDASQVDFATQVTGVPINQISNNLLDTGSWRDAAPIAGGAIGRFILNGGTANNLITGLYSGPSGIGEAIWQCQSDAQSVIDGPAGGWNYNVSAADGFSPGRGYQLSVWAFQTSFDADVYLGTGGGDGPSILNLDGSTNDNPYFWAGDLPQLGKWYLIIGIVHPSSTISMQSGISGVYDPETGVRVLAGIDFKCAEGMTQIVHRAYQFYPTAAGVVTYFARPRVDEANGNQPNIAALMSSTALHNRNQLWDDVGGPNKAADNATKNIWRISPNDPGGSDGDGWKDTSTTPARFRLRVAGAYVDVSSLVTDTAQITDGAQLGLTALWAGVVGPNRPMDNATNDGYIDTRNVDEPPSFYRSTYRPKAFKDASVLGIPGAAAATFGALLTEADFGDASGGAVKQRFILGFAGAGVAYVRVSVSETTWDAWMRDFNGFAPPRLGGAGDLLDQSGVALTDARALNSLQTWVQLNGMPANLSLLSGSEAILNGSITIGANGQLLNAGGGAVTIAGLGYIGALNATFGANWTTNVSNLPANLSLLNGSEAILNLMITPASIGFNGALAQLDPAAAAALASAGGGGMTVGLNQIITRRLTAGQSATFNAAVSTNAGGNSGNLSVAIQVSPAGTNAFGNIQTSAQVAVGPGEPGSTEIGGVSYTNNSGITQSFDFRAIAVRAPATAGGTVITNQSYLNG